MGKRLLALPVVIPICLFLISFGIRLPDLGNLCSTPKPRPRAVLETTNKTPGKAPQHATTRYVHAAAVIEAPPLLSPPATIATTFYEEVSHLVSITPPRTGARAPPLSC